MQITVALCICVVCIKTAEMATYPSTTVKRKLTFLTAAATWNDAATYCGANYGSLLEDSSDATEEMVKNYKDSDSYWKNEWNNDYWFGLFIHDISTPVYKSEGSCSDVDISLYERFDGGAPLQADLDSTKLCTYSKEKELTWIFEKCSSQYPSVCQQTLGPCTYERNNLYGSCTRPSGSSVQVADIGACEAYCTGLQADEITDGECWAITFVEDSGDCFPSIDKDPLKYDDGTTKYYSSCNQKTINKVGSDSLVSWKRCFDEPGKDQSAIPSSSSSDIPLTCGIVTTTTPATTTTTASPTTTTTQPETTTTTQPETTTTTQPETTTTTQPETTTTTQPETTTTTQPETTTTTQPETTTTTQPETTTTTQPETTTTTQPETTTTTQPETTTTTQPETTTTTQPETTTTTQLETTTTTQPETTTTTQPETTTTIQLKSTSYGSIYADGCHDPPLVAGGRGKLLNDTTVRYKCYTGYSIQGMKYMHCVNKKWLGPIPQCVPVYNSHRLDNYITLHREVERAEPLPTWFLQLTVGCAGAVALSLLVGTLLCCLHMLGCYSGPVMSFGAKHVYPRRHKCTCGDYCCCCCRCCKFCRMCCSGDEGEEDEEEDDEQKVAMLTDQEENQYPSKTNNVRNQTEGAIVTKPGSRTDKKAGDTKNPGQKGKEQNEVEQDSPNNSTPKGPKNRLQKKGKSNDPNKM